MRKSSAMKQWVLLLLILWFCSIWVYRLWKLHFITSLYWVEVLLTHTH